MDLSLGEGEVKQKESESEPSVPSSEEAGEWQKVGKHQDKRVQATRFYSACVEKFEQVDHAMWGTPWKGKPHNVTHTVVKYQLAVLSFIPMHTPHKQTCI
jgi:hypothetical protein